LAWTSEASAPAHLCALTSHSLSAAALGHAAERRKEVLASGQRAGKKQFGISPVHLGGFSDLIFIECRASDRGILHFPRCLVKKWNNFQTIGKETPRNFRIQCVTKMLFVLNVIQYLMKHSTRKIC